MLEIGAVAVIVAGGAYALSLVKRSRAHARWSGLLEQAAQSLGGRASPAGMFDGPELRGRIKGRTVTLKLKNVHRPGKGLTIAEASLGGHSEPLRLYIGWDLRSLPKGLEHVPAIAHPRTSVLEGQFIVRSNDETVANRIFETLTIDLMDIRREVEARGIEITCRGGHLTLALHGTRESAATLERIARFAVRLAETVASPPRSAASEGASSPRAASRDPSVLDGDDLEPRSDRE